jgi:hypothetical protein
MRKKHLVAIAAAMALSAAIPIIALGGTNNGTIDSLMIRTGGDFETSSGNWITVDTFPVEVVGPLTGFNFTGEGYALDYGPGGVFKGRKHAATRIRLKINGSIIAPGAMTFASNAGVKGSRSPRGMGNSLEWFYQSGAETLDVQIQVRGKNPNDISGLRTWSVHVVRNEPT